MEGRQGNRRHFESTSWGIDREWWKDISDALISKVWKPECMHKVKFIWEEKLVTLDELLLENTSKETYQKIYEEMKNSPFPQEPIPILKKELIPPAQPKYYIPRTFFYLPSTELDVKLFTSKSVRENIFLFKGIRIYDIAPLSGYQATALSGDQLHDVNVSFIELECDEDFDRICNNTTKPVHMIRFMDGHYFWTKSSKGLELIRQFLKEERRNMDEQEFVTRIASLPPPSTLSIADSPGMGKTLVLAKLATNIKETVPGSINLFIVLQEFIQQVSAVNKCLSALEAVAEYAASGYKMTKLILIEMLTMHQLNLYLDGYDEVMQDKLDIVDSFLKELQNLQNVRAIVSTRPHLQTRLVIIFNQFSYHIRPFNESNQIDFLTKYWINQHEVEKGEPLEKFAKQCLTALETKLTDTDKNIAGIPLQSMMLAEVYAEDALRASKLDLVRENVVQPVSMFEVYKNLIEIKFRRSANQKYLDAHVWEALALLFPNWLHAFKFLQDGRREIKEDILFSIGLLEKSPNQHTPRFVHRTFAEYLLAEFIVNNLNKQMNCINLLFKEILGRRGTDEVRSERYGNRVLYHALKYPVIAYFIDLHLREYAKNHVLEALLPSYFLRLFSKIKFSSEDVCIAVGASCKQNHEYTFHYALLVLRKSNVWCFTRDKYFKRLPYTIIRHTHNVRLLHEVLEFTKLKFVTDLNYHNLKKSREDYTPRYWLKSQEVMFTPLHCAVIEGKYNFVTYLVKRYGNSRINNLKYLLHSCAVESIRSDKLVIEEKLLIIDMLVKINPSWLEERTIEYQYTPLLVGDVHVSLLKCLVKHGADINAVSSKGATVLNRMLSDIVIEKNTFLDVVRWALSNGFNLINQKWHGETPIMMMLSICGSVSDDVLRLLHEVGADFNAEGFNGNSILFYALIYSGSVDSIRKLLEYGADIRHINDRKQNVLHMVVMGPRNRVQYVFEDHMIDDRLLIINMLVSINRVWLHMLDDEKCTPLLIKDVNLILLQRLVEHGADINAYSSVHGTVLHTSCTSFYPRLTPPQNQFIDVFRWALSNNFNLINHTNLNNETSLMIAIRNFGTLDDEVLKLFREARADFNAQDKNGDSVLFYALEYLRDVKFIRTLLEYGVDVNHSNHEKQNAVHKIRNGKWNSEQKSALIKMLESKGFKED